MKDGCPFCEYDGPSRVLYEYDYEGESYFVIEPLDPVTAGHLLVIPRRHVEHVGQSAPLAAGAFKVAAGLAEGRAELRQSYNLITSKGLAATQTVRHFHVHIVPRREGDGLLLPWSVT